MLKDVPILEMHTEESRRSEGGDEREDTREQTTRKCFHYSRIKAPPPPSQLVIFNRGKWRTGRMSRKASHKCISAK